MLNFPSKVKKPQLLSASEVVGYFLSLDPQRKYFVHGKMPKVDGIAIPTIGNFRLNKLLHISHLLYAAKYGKWLFSDHLMAFEHGGVVYDVYRRFHFLVRQPDHISKNLTASQKKFLSKIFQHFQSYSNEELEKFVHDDPAWHSTWNKESKGEIKQMPKTQEMLNYYQKFVIQVVEEVGL